MQLWGWLGAPRANFCPNTAHEKLRHSTRLVFFSVWLPQRYDPCPTAPQGIFYIFPMSLIAKLGQDLLDLCQVWSPRLALTRGPPPPSKYLLFLRCCADDTGDHLIHALSSQLGCPSVSSQRSRQVRSLRARRRGRHGFAVKSSFFFEKDFFPFDDAESFHGTQGHPAVYFRSARSERSSCRVGMCRPIWG